MFGNLFNFRIKGLIIIFFISISFISTVNAQETEKLTLSISPPLIKVNMNPGEKWNGNLTVVNNNSTSTQIYVSSQDFKSNEQGNAEFIPAGQEESYKYSLSQWLEFAPGPIEIPAEQSREIPFTINLPADAEPGGHYAALLAGTKPAEKISGTGISVSSLLASLIMLDIKGPTEEKGGIKEFSTDKKFYNTAKVKFKVSFNNQGNVHLQPRGEIKIYNMFNQEKGSISINQQTEFGNVLPQSNREWEYDWSQKTNLFDMGRYKAILFLNFGQSAQETVSQTTFFWFVFTKPLLLTLGSLLFFVIIFTLLIRRYIKRAVMVAQNNAGVVTPNSVTKHKISVIPDTNGTSEQLAPIKSKQEIKMIKKRKDYSGVKNFLLASFLALLVVSAIVFYLYRNGTIKIPRIFLDKGDDLAQETSYLVNNNDNSIEIINDESTNEAAEPIATTTNDEAKIATTSDEVISQNNKNEEEKSNILVEEKDKDKSVIILNGSGREGAAKQAEDLLAKNGLKIKSIGNADNYDYLNTVIQYKPNAKVLADNINDLIPGKNEVQEIDKGEADIIIIIGRNYN